MRGAAAVADPDSGARAVIPCQRHLFDLPDEVANLNCAYMSPLLKRAAAAGAEAIVRKCRPWTISPDDFFADSERARRLFATLLGAAADDIALVPAASYGLAIAAANLRCPPAARILLLAEQFPSNVYTWRELAQRGGGEVARTGRRELVAAECRVRAKASRVPVALGMPGRQPAGPSRRRIGHESAPQDMARPHGILTPTVETS